MFPMFCFGIKKWGSHSLLVQNKSLLLEINITHTSKTEFFFLRMNMRERRRERGVAEESGWRNCLLLIFDNWSLINWDVLGLLPLYPLLLCYYFYHMNLLPWTKSVKMEIRAESWALWKTVLCLSLTHIRTHTQNLHVMLEMGENMENVCHGSHCTGH